MEQVRDLPKRNYLWILVAVGAFLFLAFASQCSFLYRANEWNDVQCYYTVAMVLRNGGVLYRDIFEQKGPYLYFIHMAAIGLSPGEYFGMFVFELLYAWVFAYATYRILGLFLENKAGVTLGTLFVLLCYFISFAFMRGDSAEEMMVPFFALSLYWLIKMAKSRALMPWWQLALSGLFCGIALFTKFTLISFYLGFALVVFILYCRDKKAGQAFLAAGIFLIGMVIAAIPALIYFGVNHAFAELWEVYFYGNVFHYSSAKTMTFGDRLFALFAAWGSRFLYGYSYFIPILFGFFYAVFQKRIPKDRVFFAILVPYAAINLMILVGGVSYPYYGLPDAAFAFIGVVALADLLGHKEKPKAFIEKKPKPIFAGALALLTVLAFVGTPNMSRMFCSKEDLMVYQMKAIIEKEENPTLLNYGTLDVGAYYVCNIQPVTKYFTGLNGDFAELKETQQRIVDEGAVTFVIALSDNLPQNIDAHYETAYTYPFTDLGRPFTYYLYRKVR